MEPVLGAQPTLSVLVLNYNYGRFLKECLASILEQSFRDFEIIVLDDASTDDSLSRIADCLEDSRVRTCSHLENRGFTASLVEGTEELSRGEFLMVISADDLVLEPDAFAIQIALLRRDTDCVAAISGYTKLGPESDRSDRRLCRGDRLIPGLNFVHSQLTDREFTVLHSGTMIRAESYHRAGGYRRDLLNYVDLAMWLALGRIGPVAYIDRPLFGYRIHGSQFSGSGKRRRDVLREGIELLGSETEAAQASGLSVSRTAVLRARIADLALADAFAGRRVRSFQRCFDALALAPLTALSSTGWWLAMARSTAGTRCWSIASAFRRFLR